MTETFKNEPHFTIAANHSHDGYARTPLGAPPERILREIAFVLKMTERVRQQMDAERQCEEVVGA